MYNGEIYWKVWKPSDDTASHVDQSDPVEDQLDDPNGSQYDSTQEGFFLDEYKEYMEILDDQKVMMKMSYT